MKFILNLLLFISLFFNNILLASSSAIQSGIYGTNFKDSLLSNISTNTGNYLFNKAGDIGVVTNSKDGSLTKTALHSLVGGSINAIKGESFINGAVISGINELLTPLSSNLNKDEQILTSQLTGILTGALINSETGAKQGYNLTTIAELNNRQLHKEEIKLSISKEAEILKVALSDNTNIDKEIIDEIFNITQLSMVDERGNNDKNAVLYILSKIKGFDEKDLNFIVNEAQEYYNQVSKNKFYVDKNTMSIKPMMDNNNYIFKNYAPDGNSKIINDTLSSLLLIKFSLAKDSVVSVSAWSFDTMKTYLNSNDQTDFIPNLIGNPYMPKKKKKLGATMSLYNTFDNILNYNEKIDLLQLQTDILNGNLK